MPDKHEVGGSSPLGPTKFSRRENLPLHYSLFTIHCEDGQSRTPVPTIIKLLKHLSKIKCFKNLMKVKFKKNVH